MKSLELNKASGNLKDGRELTFLEVYDGMIFVGDV